jgi:nicotinate-nucleotide adenylyltransferase
LTDVQTAGSDNRLVVIYGGTFDPVHSGHLDVLRDVICSLAPDQVQVVLSARPPHRDEPVSGIRHRMAMAKLAFAGEPGVAVDDCEIKRAGPSYTVWTLREMRQRFPRASLALLIGADVLGGLSDWYHGWEILSLCHVVVFSRPGYAVQVPPYLRHCLTQDTASLKNARTGNIHLLELREHDISASEIRAGLSGNQREQSLSSFSLPAGVADYIRQHKLYEPE